MNAGNRAFVDDERGLAHWEDDARYAEAAGNHRMAAQIRAGIRIRRTLIGMDRRPGEPFEAEVDGMGESRVPRFGGKR